MRKSKYADRIIDAANEVLQQRYLYPELVEDEDCVTKLTKLGIHQHDIKHMMLFDSADEFAVVYPHDWRDDQVFDYQKSI
mgnify:CR=1 FL=1